MKRRAQKKRRLLTRRQTRDKLGCSDSTLYRLQERGYLTAIKLFPDGWANRFDEAEVDAFISARFDEA